MIGSRTYPLPDYSDTVVVKKGANIPVYLLMFYLLVEYGRPHFLVPIKPALVLQLLLVLCLSTHTAQVARLFKEKYFRLYVLLLLFMSIHVFIATNNYWAFICLKTMVSYLIITVSCCIFLNNIQRLNTFLFTFMVVVGACAVNRIMNTDLLGLTGSGVFTDENDFALAMNVALPIGFFMGRTETGWKKWAIWGLCIVMVLGNITSVSRGGVIGLAAVGIVCWYFMKQKLVAMLLVIAVALLAWNFAPPHFREEMGSIGIESMNKDTGKDRIELWKVGWKAFVDNPVLGVGQGNMPIVISKYQYNRAGESFWKRDLWGRALHSVYMTVLPELGLIGSLIVAFMLMELGRTYKRIKKVVRDLPSSTETTKLANLNFAFMTSFFGFLVTGVFLSVFYYPPLWNIGALIMALHLVAVRLKQQSSGDVKATVETWQKGYDSKPVAAGDNV